MAIRTDSAEPPYENRLEATAVPARIPVEACSEDGEWLLYNPKRAEATSLNQSATEVWLLCDGSSSILDIARTLGGRYGVDAAHLIGDVMDAIDAFRARGLVRVPQGSAQGSR